jgi:hypothetical protein
MPAFKSTAKSPEIHYITVTKEENLRSEYIKFLGQLQKLLLMSRAQSKCCIFIYTYHTIQRTASLMTQNPNRLAQQQCASTVFGRFVINIVVGELDI